MPAMRLLALETSTELGSCALWQDGQCLQRVCPPGKPHSETLLPLVRELLQAADCSFAQLDGIAFGAGPGAFTGLRVACGIAQGLAVAHETPVVPVVTLEALVWPLAGERLLALLDARMNEVYTATYTRSPDGLALEGAIRVVPPDQIEIPQGTWAVGGNALKAYPGLHARMAGDGRVLYPEAMPLAEAVAHLAAPRLARGEGLDPAFAAPLYIRDKVAQTVAERLAQGGKA